MRDMRAQLEKLRTETAECEMIANLATDKAKQELCCADGVLRAVTEPELPEDFIVEKRIKD